ncbi:MAG: outer membrane beta-barrel protein [Rhizobiales bacterium]|nr:outer membrane beta-barrel protein [Hyphomicrobiales bacterium]
MRYAQVLAVAGATVLSATASLAADLGPIIEPPIYAPPVSFSSWYLRGDIGMTNQTVGKLDNVLFPGTPNLVIHDKNFESGMLFGIGVGYQWNNWLRTDITGEYRGETGFHGFDTWGSGAGARFNNYTAKKSEWLFLANAYLDLGTWWNLTPFVGAGVGASRVTIHSFRDAGTTGNPGFPTMAYADAASRWNFAWALHAGLAYQATKNLTIELAYRYVNLGHGKSGDIIAFDGTNNVNNPMEFRNLSSHDVKLGVRWAFGGGYEDGPSYTAPVHEPPPTYVEPPSIYAPPIGPRG